MRKIFYSVLAAAVVLTGCNNEIIELNGSGKGSLMFDLDCDSNYKEIVTRAGMTDEEILDALVIEFYRKADDFKYEPMTYKQVKEKGGIVELGQGHYNLTISSKDKLPVAFDQPIYEAKKEFDIKVGEITDLNTITCNIKNVKVSLELSESFMKELVSFNVTASTADGNLIWTKESWFDQVVAEGKTVYKARQAAFFSVNNITLKIDGKRASDGSNATKSYSISNVAAADHHMLKLDAKVTGSLDLDIKIDSDTNDYEQDVTVPGFEEGAVDGNNPGNGGNTDDNTGGNTGDNNTGSGNTPSATAPTLVWPSNPDFADMDLPMSMAAKVNVELDINAPKGIKEFLIYVKSAVLTPTIADMTAAGRAGIVDGVATMDMINDDVLYKQLGSGLPMKDKVLNKTTVHFSLSELVPMINMYVADITQGDKHTFTLHVVDNDGQLLEQTVTFVSVAANQ